MDSLSARGTQRLKTSSCQPADELCSPGNNFLASHAVLVYPFRRGSHVMPAWRENFQGRYDLLHENGCKTMSSSSIFFSFAHLLWSADLRHRQPARRSIPPRKTSPMHSTVLKNPQRPSVPDTTHSNSSRLPERCLANAAPLFSEGFAPGRLCGRMGHKRLSSILPRGIQPRLKQRCP